MKKIFKILLLLGSMNGFSQTDENKLKLQSTSLGFGGFHIKGNNEEDGGVAFLADITMSYKKNLFSMSYLTGAEIAIVGSSDFGFNEFSLLYGRELRAAEWLRFEGYAGIGYYNQNSVDRFVIPFNSISFPLRGNVKFYFTKKFSMGLTAHCSINSVGRNFSGHLAFHYRFNTKSNL